MKFLAPVQHAHGTADRTAVLLVNLGTPVAPTTAAVRQYLAEFLLDPRVVEIPRLPWWLLLHLAILPFRSSASAQRYAAVWMPEGSPLLVYSERQERALLEQMRVRGLDVDIVLAMRYGEPSIARALERLRREHVARLLVLPLYPQYSATTSGSTFDGVVHTLEQTRNLPELRWVRGFHDDPGYIEALRQSVLAHWGEHGRPNKLVMSFHGLPRRNLDLGDPYHCECLKTGRLLAQALDLRAEEYTVTFQSRFGRARWLEPYTADAVRALARAGLARIDVICPGFAADCLETLEEIGLEARGEFLMNGGRQFHLIPCLNDSPGFVGALADLIERQVQGWPVRIQEREARNTLAGQTAQRARALGAAQ